MVDDVEMQDAENSEGSDDHDISMEDVDQGGYGNKGKIFAKESKV